MKASIYQGEYVHEKKADQYASRGQAPMAADQLIMEAAIKSF
ncbi:hypothetical protein [Paenibacillus sp. IITD108]